MAKAKTDMLLDFVYDGVNRRGKRSKVRPPVVVWSWPKRPYANKASLLRVSRKSPNHCTPLKSYQAY